MRDKRFMGRHKQTEHAIKYKRKRLSNHGYGPEPTWDGVDHEGVQQHFSYCLTWYSACASNENKKKWTLEYLEGIKYPKIQQLNSILDKLFTTCGALARCFLRGAKSVIDASSFGKNYIEYNIDRIVEKLIKDYNQDEPKVEKRGRKPGIKKEVLYDPNIRKVMEVIELEVDRFIETNLGPNIDFVALCNSMGISKDQARIIANRYTRCKDEIELVYNENDPYLEEAYSNFNSYQINQLRDLYTSIIDGVDGVKSLGISKVRKKRKQNPEKLVKKILPLIEHIIPGTKMAVRSIETLSILGAKQLWIYNAKYRKLGVLYSKTDSGLHVKGSKITDYDLKISVWKKIRKPQIILPEFMQLGKVALRHFMETINQKDQPISSRINKETVLLRVIK
jgi:hypothetical protein